MPAILFALLSYLGWGAGDLFATIAARKIGPYTSTFWYVSLQFIIFLPLGIFFISDLNKITFELFILILSLAVLGNIGLVTFYEGIRVGNAPLVGTISSSFIALTVILSIIFLKESITNIQALAILIIFAGLVISGLDFNEIKSRNFFVNRGVLYGLISMVTWGVYWTFIKIPVVKMGWFWPSIIASSSFPLVYLYMRAKRIDLKPINYQKARNPLILNAALIGLGSLSYYYAISRGLIAIVAPIAGSYPTLFAVLAFIFFKDKITKQQVAGIITTLAGIVLLSIHSV